MVDIIVGTIAPIQGRQPRQQRHPGSGNRVPRKKKAAADDQRPAVRDGIIVTLSGQAQRRPLEDHHEPE
jgi:hypothetical protein